MASGEPLLRICRDEKLPHISTIYRWLADDPEFARLYSVARQDMAHTYFDEAIEIADETPLINLRPAVTGGLHAEPCKGPSLLGFWLLDLGSNQGPTD
jgi:hypothetical protein